MDTEHRGLVSNAEPPDTTSSSDVKIEESNHNLSTGNQPPSGTNGLEKQQHRNGHVNEAFKTTSNNNDLDYRRKTQSRLAGGNGTAVFTANGSTLVISPSRHSVQPEACPVKAKNIKFYYMFAIISFILFFPTGIAAILYAVKTHRHFKLGATSQSWTLTLKYKKRCQNAVIFSFIGFFVSLAIVISILELAYFHHDDEYWDDRFSVHSSFG